MSEDLAEWTSKLSTSGDGDAVSCDGFTSSYFAA